MRLLYVHPGFMHTGVPNNIWQELTELTLSRCSTVKLEEFNKFLEELTSLKVLNLLKMFPSPPKGCCR